MAILKREINSLSPLTASMLVWYIWCQKETMSTESPEISVFLTSRLKLTNTPIPFLKDFVEPMAGSTVFSRLDLCKSYCELELAPSIDHKTSMCTPIGLFAYKRLAVGMKHSTPPKDKVTAIREFSRPRTMKELQRFLGTVNFHWRYIPETAKTLAPLNSLLLPHKHRCKNVEWNEVAEASFIAVKQQLADTTMLAFPVLNAPAQLATDVSDTAVGAVIQQMVGGVTQPVAFFSKILTSAQRKWSTFDRKLLAIFPTVKHFKYFIDGAPLPSAQTTSP